MRKSLRTLLGKPAENGGSDGGVRQFIRFLFTGGINTVIGYALFLLVSLIGLDYRLTIFISMSLGVVANFITTGNIVFRDARASRIFRFFAVYMVNYLLNIACTGALQRVVGNLYIIQAALAFPLATLTYFLHKNFVFSDRGRKKS